MPNFKPKSCIIWNWKLYNAFGQQLRSPIYALLALYCIKSYKNSMYQSRQCILCVEAMLWSQQCWLIFLFAILIRDLLHTTILRNCLRNTPLYMSWHGAWSHVTADVIKFTHTLYLHVFHGERNYISIMTLKPRFGHLYLSV